MPETPSSVPDVRAGRLDAAGYAAAFADAAPRFTRTQARQACGLTDTALRVHLDRLVELEYVVIHRGGFGSRFVYELAFDGEVSVHSAQFIGLLDVERLRDPCKSPTLQGSATSLQGVKAKLAPTLHPENTQVAPTLQGEETSLIASADAHSSSLVAAVEQTAEFMPHAPRPSHRNGSAAPVKP